MTIITRNQIKARIQTINHIPQSYPFMTKEPHTMTTQDTQDTPNSQSIHNGDRYCLNCGLKQIKGEGFCSPCRYGGGSHRVVIKGAIKYFCRLIGSSETCKFDKIPDGYELIEEIKY